VENNRAIWRLGDISDVSEAGDHGCIRAKFDLASGPSIPSTVAVQFLSEGSSISGIDFDLTGLGYRVSLVKKRFITGNVLYEFVPQTNQYLLNILNCRRNLFTCSFSINQ
jgi:hypothetical protein